MATSLSSDWFQDLWYPLSKANSPHMGGVGVVEKRPIIVTQSLLEWMGFQGKDLSDKQEKFSRVLIRNNIPYTEIGYDHPLAIEYPCVQKEARLIPKQVDQKRWLCLELREFKKAVMRLQTENGDLVRDYYLNLEEIMFAYGEYTHEFLLNKMQREASLRDLELSEAMSQLTIKESQLAIKDREEEELKEQLEQEKERAERIQEELEDTREHALILQEMMIKDEPIEQTQVIYIATTELYAKSNNFKPGGVDDTGKLKSRLSTYNTGRLKEDLFYYSDVFMVSNYHVIEAQLKNLLGRFRNKKEKEMYRMHYNDIKYIVEYLCKRDGEDVNEVNLKLGEFISNLNKRSLRPVVPDPDTRYISSTVQLNEDGTVTNMTIQSKTPQEFRLQLEAYIRGLDSTTTTISKKKVFDDLNVKKDRVNKLPLLQQLLRQLKPQIRLVQKSK
ncbi:hypothetical protein DH26_gp147 [Chloriridovirus anopheles1]|uniref:MSV199 domain-containing protein n=1 Tax=Chloriridovirus anopheles1 TaxID=1465751 RepID=W8QF79_9VIRU|nr:hypothetical protein DH26_gp147 [Anopheles minimus iridovirus]AHL67634.1 hypothetical protein AMIV_147 [Anopheles minimus iridovirus]